MGNWNSGRRPVPTALKALRGTLRRGRVNALEPYPPAPTVSFDDPPDELHGDALAVTEWKRIVPMLRVCGVISQAERSVLIALCTEWSRWTEANQNIRQLGMLIKGKDGLPVRNPFIRIANDSLKQCQRLWTELGLTPSSRARLAGIPPGPVPQTSRWGDDL